MPRRLNIFCTFVVQMVLTRAMTEVIFDAQGVAMPAIDRVATAAWLECVAHSLGKNVGRLSYLFCDDEHILAINREFLQHDYYTDIITFDYSTRRRIAGDMVISLDTVASNAAQLGVDPRRELLRVIVHGVLHLCGINDKGPGEREVMEAHEEQALAMLPNDETFNFEFGQR